ncbi:MAG: glycosyltransferase [Actinobacteria bacterium]|nr:glycosyltransferase [Actinomycetota bacterium]
MRILLVNPAYVPAVDYGGPVAKLQTLAAALRDLGHQPEVWTADFDLGRGRVPAGRREVDGVPVRYFRRLATYHWSPIVPQVVAAAARSRFDVVHCFGMRDGFTHLAALGFARAGTPYVVEPVGMHAPLVRGLLRKRVFDRAFGDRYIEQARGLVATSERERRALSADTRSSIWLRYNPVEMPAAPSEGQDLRRRLGVPTLWGSEKAQFLASLDAFALPSITESFGNAAAEAAALGVRVVVSDQCGVADLLQRLGAATVVPRDAEKLSAAIRAALTSSRANDAFVTAKAVREALSPVAIARRQAKIYAEVLDDTTLRTSSS